MILRLGVLLCVGVVFFSGVRGAQADDVEVTVSATIQQAYSVNKTSDLNFGALTPMPAGETYTIDRSAELAATSSGALTAADVVATGGSSNGGSPSAGVISITTTIPGVTINNLAFVDASGGGPTITLTGPGATTLTLDGAAMNSLSNLTLVNTALTAAGTAYLHLGGVLAVPANAEDGVYTGTMTVSLTF